MKMTREMTSTLKMTIPAQPPHRSKAQLNWMMKTRPATRISTTKTVTSMQILTLPHISKSTFRRADSHVSQQRYLW
jgi:hypothetical protein